jgi:hypothetical protein
LASQPLRFIQARVLRSTTQRRGSNTRPCDVRSA